MRPQLIYVEDLIFPGPSLHFARDKELWVPQRGAILRRFINSLLINYQLTAQKSHGTWELSQKAFCH